MRFLQFQIAFGESRRWLAAVFLLLAVACLALQGAKQAPRSPLSRTVNSQPATPEVLAAYGKLPMTFEKNQGQSDPSIKFLAHGQGYALFLTDNEAILSLKGRKQQNAARTSVLRVSMAGSSPSPEVEGLDLQPGKTNYLIGNDPSRWHRNVPLYGRVRYRNVYPGIDALYYGNQQQLETDFVVAPGSHPEKIRLQINGGKALRLDDDGDFVIASASGDLTLRHPTAYQMIDGGRQEVAANFALRGPDSLGIDLGMYDSAEPLVIDPVIVYSTYLGGSTASVLAETSATAVAVDSSGDAYVTGTTDTTDFPTTAGAYATQTTSGGGFITKFNATGTGLIYSTFIGGSVGASPAGIALDSSGDVYVTGQTVSTDFPVTSSAIQPVYPPGNVEGTVFFVELDPTGSTLLYGTYLGGNGYQDTPYGIALDQNANAYIVGSTSSTNFPTTPTALQRNNNSAGAPAIGANNVFVSRIDATKIGLNALVYSTYLGGSGDDNGSAIAVDANSNAYIVGAGGSVPTSSNAYQTSPDGGATAFVARIDTVNSVLVYSSFIGSSASQQPELGNCIAIDSNGNAYIGGQTFDTNFPVTTGAFETTFPGASGIGTGFVAEFNTVPTTQAPATLVWATYLGGSISGDQPHAIALDSLDNIYLAGETWSGELPTGSYPASLGAPDTTGVAGLQNGFMTVMTSDGSAVAFSTYYGTGGAGTNSNAVFGLALDTASPPDVFIVGLTNSTKFPTTAGSFQTTKNGFLDAFVAELSPAAAQGVFATPSSLSFGNQAKGTTSPSQAVTLTNATNNTLSGITISFTGTNAADFGETNTCGTAPATLASGGSCTINVTFTPSTTNNESASLSVADSDSSSPQTVALTGTGTPPAAGVTLTPTSLNFGSFTKGQASSPQTFTLSNNSASAITITGSGATVTGTNAADFVIQTNTCPAVNSTLAAGSTCAITIVFTPSTTSSESATLSVSDSDASSPQTSALSGSGTAPSGTVTLSPSTMSFGNINVNSTSPSQSATLSNTEATTLTITSVTVTGANASDFAASNKCGSSLAASSTCTISVTFTPTTTAPESATLTVTDSDSTSPQTVALSGTGIATGPDFTISASPSSATVGTHGTITATVSVNSVDGFNSPVTLNCGSLPGDSSCAFTTNPLTPPANGSTSTMLTFATSSGVFAATPNSRPRIPSIPSGIAMLGIVGLAVFRMWRFSGRGARRIVCAFALLSIVGLASCTGTPSTPTGTFTVRLTGTAGAATHAFSFTLTVN